MTLMWLITTNASYGVNSPSPVVSKGLPSLCQGLITRIGKRRRDGLGTGRIRQAARTRCVPTLSYEVTSLRN